MMMIMMNHEIIELKRTQARTISMVVIWQQKFAMSLKRESKQNEEKGAYLLVQSVYIKLVMTKAFH